MDNPNKSEVRGRKKKNGGLSVRMAAVILLLAAGVVFGAMLMIPAFSITEVYCEGLNNLSGEDIITTANIKNGTNILLANIGGARRSIKKNAMVKDVKLRRVFPNKICITVEERTPAAYVLSGSQCVLVDCDGVVIENVQGDKSAQIVQKNTPNFEAQTDSTQEDNKDGSKNQSSSESKNSSGGSADNENDSSSDDSASDKTDKKSSDNSNDTENNQNNQAGDGSGSSENGGDNSVYSVPLTVGIELSSAEEGKTAASDDSAKLDKLFEICNALNDAGLLNRSTYIDLTDMTNVNAVIENRLDIRLGIPDNMAYRAKFLAETINTKISSTEVLILDYTGNDIYARPHEDGKDRVDKKSRKTNTDKKTGGNTVSDDGSSSNKSNSAEDGTSEDSASSKKSNTEAGAEDSRKSANTAASDTEL